MFLRFSQVLFSGLTPTFSMASRVRIGEKEISHHLADWAHCTSLTGFFLSAPGPLPSFSGWYLMFLRFSRVLFSGLTPTFSMASRVRNGEKEISHHLAGWAHYTSRRKRDVTVIFSFHRTFGRSSSSETACCQKQSKANQDTRPNRERRRQNDCRRGRGVGLLSRWPEATH